MHDLGLRLTDLALTKRGRQHSLDLQKASVRLVLNKIKEMGFCDDAKLDTCDEADYPQLGSAWLETIHLVAATQWVAEQLGASYNTLKATMTQYLSGNELSEPNTAQRGKGSLTWVSDAELHKDTLIEAMGAFIKERLAEAKVTTTPLIQDMFLQKHNLVVSPSAVRYCLINFLHYSFGKVVAIGLHDPKSDNSKLLFRQFIVRYNKALQEQEDGAAVVVYSDESYVNTHHHAQYGWFGPEMSLRSPSGKGARLIILHALTRDGLL